MWKKGEKSLFLINCDVVSLKLGNFLFVCWLIKTSSVNGKQKLSSEQKRAQDETKNAHPSKLCHERTTKSKDDIFLWQSKEREWQRQGKWCGIMENCERMREREIRGVRYKRLCFLGQHFPAFNKIISIPPYNAIRAQYTSNGRMLQRCFIRLSISIYHQHCVLSFLLPSPLYNSCIMCFIIFLCFNCIEIVLHFVCVCVFLLGSVSLSLQFRLAAKFIFYHPEAIHWAHNSFSPSLSSVCVSSLLAQQYRCNICSNWREKKKLLLKAKQSNPTFEMTLFSSYIFGVSIIIVYGCVYVVELC